ncbi:Exportin-1, partial [Sarracenia purpurea var. burkii]
MITKNFEDYPEHCLKFFSLLHAIAGYCFPALIRLSSEQLKLVMDSIIWAFRHTERNIAETGLNLLLEMLKNFQACTFLACSDLKKPSSQLAFTIGDSVKPKTGENITVEMKLRCLSVTVLDSSCGM